MKCQQIFTFTKEEVLNLVHQILMAAICRTVTCAVEMTSHIEDDPRENVAFYFSGSLTKGQVHEACVRELKGKHKVEFTSSTFHLNEDGSVEIRA